MNILFRNYIIKKPLFFIITIVLCIVIYFTLYKNYYNQPIYENMKNITTKNEYLGTLMKHNDERHFPYRYLHDGKNNILPIVMISAFFRDNKERVDLYNEYVNNNIKIIGITAYKSFPKPITDASADSSSKDDTFDYYSNIKNWLVCFKNPTKYGFDSRHNLLQMSESDFYDADISAPYSNKKYDMIYVCLKDNDSCPKDGWNAINRNFNLALKCFPIIINEFNMNVLVVGRVNCGLDILYGDKITVVDFLDFYKFQDKLKESKILFIPNIYDASPRIVAECIIKDIPVLMNQSIVCGSNYINDETGELFTDEHDIRFALTNLLGRIDKISPKKWWSDNYSKKKSAKKLRDFLIKEYPDELKEVEEVHFFL